MKFTITDEMQNYSDILRMPLQKCLCRRVIKIESDKSKKLYDLLKNTTNALWGYEDNLKFFDNDRFRQFMVSVQNMVIFKDFKPFRIVIDKVGNVWIDNIQVATKDLLISDMGITIGECGHYIIDLRGDIPVVAGSIAALSSDLMDIMKSVELADKHFGDSMPDEAREIKYTLSEFLKDNGVHKGMVTLSEETIASYKSFSLKQVIKRWRMAD